MNGTMIATILNILDRWFLTQLYKDKFTGSFLLDLEEQNYTDSNSSFVR